jgi:YbbR domain-containing protein
MKSQSFHVSLYRKIRSGIAKLLDQNVFIIIMSVVAAILIWFTISVTVYPDIVQQLSGITVEVVTDGTYAADHNFRVASMSAQTVTVSIEGMRADIGDIKPDDLIAAVSAEGVLSAKDYTLPVTVTGKDGRRFSVVSVDPPQITVNFEEFVTERKPVVAQSETLLIADGYMSDNIAVSPSEVSVTGSKDIVSRISEIRLDIPQNGAADSSFEVTVGSSDMKLYNGNVQMQNAINDLIFDRTEFNIIVPVYRKQTVDLDVNVANAPETFDVESFKRSLVYSVDTLEIAALDQVSALTSLNIGTIDIRQINFESDSDMSFEFRASDFLQDGYENLSGVTSVVVTIPFQNISKRIVMIPSSNIQLINRPLGFRYQIITSGITPLFVGNSAEISSLTREDIVAVVDMNANHITAPGDYKLTVQFSLPEYPHIWSAAVSGVLSQKVTVTVTRE